MTVVMYSFTPRSSQKAFSARMLTCFTVPCNTKVAKDSTVISAFCPGCTFLIIDSWILAFTSIRARSGSLNRVC